MLKMAASCILLIFTLSGCTHEYKKNSVKQELTPFNSNNRADASVLNQDLQAFNKSSQRLNAPFNLALKSVEDYIKDWLLRPSEVTPIELSLPTRPTLPKAPILAKGEFETTKQFETRLAREKLGYSEILNSIKQAYVDKVDAYNAAIKFYNSEVQWERRNRQEQVASIRTGLLNTAINEVLGTPKLVNVKYNADKEIFNAKIIAEDSAISYDVIIPIAINNAQEFKQNAESARIAIRMSLEGRIRPLDFRIDNKGSYIAYLSSNEAESVLTKQRSAGVQNIDLNDVAIDRAEILKVGDIIESNEKYFKALF